MSGENPTPQDPEANPADVEAALQAAGASPEPATPDPVTPDPAASIPTEQPPAPAENAEISQADIDAVLQSADAEAPPPLDSAGRPYDDAAAMMAAAIAEERAAAASSGGSSIPALPLDLPSFTGALENASSGKIGLLNDVELDVKIELGRAAMLIEEVLRLGEGSVVELDKLAGDPVDVRVNGRLVARGEVLVLNDNFCVRISEILAGNEAEAA